MHFTAKEIPPHIYFCSPLLRKAYLLKNSLLMLSPCFYQMQHALQKGERVLLVTVTHQLELTDCLPKGQRPCFSEVTREWRVEERTS